MTNDQFSDFLTRIRNAGRARLSKVDVFDTKMNRRVAEILVEEGYIKSYKDALVDNKKRIRLFLKFEGGNLKKPVIQGLRRASRPGRRLYVGSDKLPKVMTGFGIAILSTSKGVVTERQARKLGVGGEFLCSVW